MVTKERLQIILDLAPFTSQQLIKSIVIDDKKVEIEGLEIDGRGNTYTSKWSMPVKGKLNDEHSLG
jgi:hypothetical protein